MEAGMVPSPSIDTLLMYAYAQRGVEHVELKINMGVEEGSLPKVEYHVRLEPTSRLKWIAVQKARTITRPIFQKAALLALMKAGAPVHLESAIRVLAQSYLPEKFSVEVKIVE